MFNFVCACVCVCVSNSTGSCESQIQVHGTEFRSSALAVCVLHCETMSSAPTLMHSPLDQ